MCLNYVFELFCTRRYSKPNHNYVNLIDFCSHAKLLNRTPTHAPPQNLFRYMEISITQLQYFRSIH